MGAGGSIRSQDAAADLPVGFACVPAVPAPRISATAGKACGKLADRSLHGVGLARMGLSVLASGQQRADQQIRGKDRRAGTACSYTAVH